MSSMASIQSVRQSSTASAHHYILVSSPGSGKGTLAQVLCTRGYESVSLGDIMRSEIQQKTPFGLQYREAIIRHTIGIIPEKVVQNILIQKIENVLRMGKRLVLDGYPQTHAQCEHLDWFFEQKKLTVKCIFIHIDPKLAIERISFRRVCEKCNHIYNIKFSPPKKTNICDFCGGKLMERLGDIQSEIAKRVACFHEKMKPIIEYYNKRFIYLDGSAAPSISVAKLYALEEKRNYTIPTLFLVAALFALAFVKLKSK